MKESISSKGQLFMTNVDIKTKLIAVFNTLNDPTKISSVCSIAVCAQIIKIVGQLVAEGYGR